MKGRRDPDLAHRNIILLQK